MTYHLLSINVDDLTVGRLTEFLDQARCTGAVDDQPIGLEASDSQGKPDRCPRHLHRHHR